VDRRSAGIEGGGIVEGRRRRIAVAGAAVAALGLAAGGATYAATNGGPQEEANALAEALNENEGTSLTGQDIQDALKDVLKERLDDAVKSGKITQEEADRILERASERGFPLGPGPGGPDFHIEFRGGPVMDAAAKALGLSEDALEEQLEDGKSLADIAAARNVDKSKVVAAVRDAILADPPPGRDAPTEAEATRIAEAIVNGKRAPLGPDGPGFHIEFRGGPFIEAATKALGLSEDALREQLGAGKSLADIAAARNVDKSKVVAAVRDAILAEPPPGGDAPTKAEATRIAQDIVNGKRVRHRAPFPGPPPFP
jgi:hypothetical protein